MYVNKKTNYTQDKNFLKSAHIVTITATATQAMGVTVGAQELVVAGTVFPANDATAKGIVYETVDVTNGDQPVAIIVDGHIIDAYLPEPVDVLAKPVLTQITLY
jgi:hypothetical protein